MSNEIKRQNENSKNCEENREVKFRRLEAPEGNPDPETSEEMTSTGILILNDDCYQEIFMQLDVDDLLSVIQSNTRFKLPCEYVFKRMWHRIPFHLSNLHNNYVSARMMEHSIRKLKHFGHLLSSLWIEFKFGEIERLLDAIAEHCDDNLLELRLDHAGVRPRRPWSAFGSSIERMKLFLSDLSTQFPRLRHLQLDYSIVSKHCPYSQAVLRSIPSLTSFGYDETVAGRLFTEEKLENFVKLNPQLECLKFSVDRFELFDTEEPWYISDSFIRCLNESLPMLKCLKINRVSTGHLPGPPHTPIGFKNLKELKFHCFLEADADPHAGFMSFLSDSVEILKLSIFRVRIDDFIKDIIQFKNLKVLHLEYPMKTVSLNVDANNLDRLIWAPDGIKQLILNNPNLTEIVLSQHPYDDDADTLDNIYENVTEYNVGASRWIVSNEYWDGYSFRKVLQ